jgi:mRNA interferase RelE/StbE
MRIVYSGEFERALRKWKKKDNHLFEQLVNKMERIVNDPTVGKPLRYTLKNRRRIHVNSFVIVYEFHNNELRFIDFDHHDKVYKK